METGTMVSVEMFEFSRPRENLSFTHHREVCAITGPAIQDRFLDWWMGDWWNYGERKWGTGQELCERLGFNYKTVRMWATIAQSYQLFNRLNNLTHTHHLVAAPLDD